jgi:tRNA A-37 threonylcarbamoyl transferase component Bud32
MEEEICQYLQSLNDEFSVSDLVILTEKITFKVVTHSSKAFPEIVKVSLSNELSESLNFLYRLEMLSDDSFIRNNSLLNSLNLKMKIGVFGVSSSTPVQFYLIYSIPLCLFPNPTKIQTFLSILPSLLKTFTQLKDEYSRSTIETLSTHIKKLQIPSSPSEDPSSSNFEDSSSENSDDACEVCLNNLDDCDCSLKAKLKENIYKNDLETLKVLKKSGIWNYFDFDSVFFVPETLEYYYNPGTSLENQLKKHKISLKFVKKFENLIQTMKKNKIFFRSFPQHLFIVSIEKNEISNFFFALIFSGFSDFKKIFTSNKPEGYSEFLKNKLMELCIISTQKYLFSDEDFISPENLENFQVESTETLGSGGFANVFKNRLAGLEVAIKIPHLRKEDYKESIMRVQREFSVLKSMNHKNIVRTFGIVEVGEKICIVMKYCKGSSLKKIVEVLRADKIVGIMKGVALGMFRLHKSGIVHQDLKPSNVLIVGDHPKIIDLGLAVHESHLQSVSGFTVEFSDPSQLLQLSSGKPADVWSFAITFIACLFKTYPYVSVIPRDLMNYNNEIKFIYSILVEKKRPVFGKLLKIVMAPVRFLIESCLNSCPEKRPSFLDIIRIYNRDLM